jgi:glycosyltransferase involved in cell wall biosynthesis
MKTTRASKAPQLSVLIPCYNEEENAAPCIAAVPAMPWTTEIICIDDGSKDNTASVVREVMKKDKRVKLVSYMPNGGKGFALMQGIAAARGEVVIVLDADMATPPSEIPAIVGPIFEGKADFVNGSRMIYPMEKGAMSGLHKLGNRGFAVVVSLMIGKRLTDTLCGYKAWRRGMMTDFKERSWPDFEYILKARKARLRIMEVPTHYKARVAGESKMKTWSHGWKMLKMLIRSSGY